MLKKLGKHPSLVFYALRHPSMRQLRERAKHLDSLDRDPMHSEIRLRSIGKRETKFTLEGAEYDYFYDDYNKTWGSERAVEVPIIWRIVQARQSAQILEVGNVLSHYFDTRHVIVDKFEKGPGVVNEDILDYSPPTKFDLVVSISTIEHIGWSTKHGPRNPILALRALDKMSSLLRPGGELWFTIPLGYNSYLDGLVRERNLSLNGMFFMRRTSASNVWEQCGLEDAIGQQYGGFKLRWSESPPFPKANAILIGVREMRG
jgi:hypothetical protein